MKNDKAFKVRIVGGHKRPNKFNKKVMTFKEMQREEFTCITEDAARSVMESKTAAMTPMHERVIANIQSVDIIGGVIMEDGIVIAQSDTQ